MPPVRSVDGATVVLRGRFNPSIFQPAWFVRNGLIGEKEGEDLSDLLVTGELTNFVSGTWLQVQVTDDRFLAHASDEIHFAPLRDLVHSTFAILEHTPMTSMGLNRESHYEMPSEETWHSIGDTLAPKDLWTQLFEGRPGMRSLVIEGQRAASKSKYFRAKIEPSSRIQHGVFLETNEHFQMDEGNAPPAELMQFLKANWHLSMAHAEAIASKLFAYCRVKG